MSQKLNENPYTNWAMQNILDEVNIALATTNIPSFIQGFTNFRDDYLLKLPISQTADIMYAQFSPDILKYFNTGVERPMEEDEYAYDLFGIKMKVMTDITANIDEVTEGIKETLTYEKLAVLYPNVDVTMLAIVMEFANHTYSRFFADLLTEAKDKLPKEFKGYAQDIIDRNNEIFDLKDRNEIIAKVYELAKICDEGLDFATAQEYEWTSEEGENANLFLAWMQQMAQTWWFLMILREQWVKKNNLMNDPNVYKEFAFSTMQEMFLDKMHEIQEANKDKNDD